MLFYWSIGIKGTSHSPQNSLAIKIIGANRSRNIPVRWTRRRQTTDLESRGKYRKTEISTSGMSGNWRLGEKKNIGPDHMRLGIGSVQGPNPSITFISHSKIECIESTIVIVQRLQDKVKRVDILIQKMFSCHINWASKKNQPCGQDRDPYKWDRSFWTSSRLFNGYDEIPRRFLTTRQ